MHPSCPSRPALQSVAFGMGGGLLQRLNRDTLSLATKLSHIVYADGTGEHCGITAAASAACVGARRCGSCAGAGASHQARGPGTYLPGRLRMADLPLFPHGCLPPLPPAAVDTMKAPKTGPEKGSLPGVLAVKRVRGSQRRACSSAAPAGRAGVWNTHPAGPWDHGR